ncbi:MAG: hypothetical protein A3I61_13435 [Acidobacteria bacterium RIFCSPLOWO2_02_FULL_68_18]|nr:MAG: hypothetical protein A3I61_13435 [Acidobacteria bacterium RIFCSPLOWO2_02_FULL_68_18]
MQCVQAADSQIGTVAMRYIEGALHVMLLGSIVITGTSACGSGTIRNSASEETRSDTLNDLPDGAYSCEAFNATRGNGPYSLDCDKFGSSVTIHFSNGGYVEVDVDLETTADGFAWNITGTNADNGEEWEIAISR